MTAASSSTVVDEARRWLDANWDPRRTVRDWWRLAAEAGWLFPSWPVGLGGRGLNADASRAISEAFAASGALGPPFGVGQTHGAPIVGEFGDQEQQRRLMPPVAYGIEQWCQFFSEPGAGSDLAGVRTTARRDGDAWIVSGQKVWTSGAMHSSRGILLARTDADAPKHKGLSFFVIDLDQPGVEIRPIKQMNGSGDYFNESFFDDAVVPDRNLIGGEGAGWRLALATLAFEREMNARVPGLVTASPGPHGGALDRPAGDVVAEGEQTVPYFANRAFVRSDRLIEIARDRGRTDVADIRQSLARLHTLDRVVEWNDARAKAQALHGNEPGVEANLIKLARSAVGRAAQHVAGRIIGADAMLTRSDGYRGGAVAEMILTVPSFSIAGGTDEIQHNVVGERGLGLPREPNPEAR